jgi:hypothetical protein
MNAVPLNQRIARLALVKVFRALADPVSEDPYVDGSDRRYLGEDDRGNILAPRADSADWWEPFDFHKPGHMDAWRATAHDGRIAFLELETES